MHRVERAVLVVEPRVHFAAGEEQGPQQLSRLDVTPETEP